MRIAVLTTDNREHQRTYQETQPRFGPAIEAVLQGLAELPELEIHVISCTQRPMHAPEKLSDNTWFHLLHVPKIGWLRTGYQGCIRAIRRKLQEIQPDLVHGQGTERELRARRSLLWISQCRHHSREYRRDRAIDEGADRQLLVVDSDSGAVRTSTDDRSVVQFDLHRVAR